MWLKLPGLAALIYLLLTTGPARAAEVFVAPPLRQAFSAPFPERHNLSGVNATLPRRIDLSSALHIRIEGEIRPTDEEKLRPLLAQLERFPNAVVSLNSTGGHYETGLLISDMVQAAAVSTLVGPGDVCFSACSIIFLGGRTEMIRNVLYRPSRYLHAAGRLGFHAPFLQQKLVFPGDANQILEAIADYWAGYARQGIRQIQMRIEAWQITPMFVFEFLGAAPDDVYEIDTYEKAQTNGIELLTPETPPPRDLGFAEALSACSLVLSTNLAQVYDNRHYLRVFDDLTRREDAAASSSRAMMATLDSSGRSPSYRLQGLVTGRGPFGCQVSADAARRWVVRTSGDYPRVENGYGKDFRIDAAGYVPNSFTVLGPRGSWRRATLGANLFGRVDPKPGELDSDPTHGRASFTCAGVQDPAAIVICAYRETREADIALAEAFRIVRDRPGVVEAQRQWLRTRDRACNITAAAIVDPRQRLMKGYCIFALMSARVSELKGT